MKIRIAVYCDGSHGYILKPGEDPGLGYNISHVDADVVVELLLPYIGQAAFLACQRDGDQVADTKRFFSRLVKEAK